ncbi:MAG: hypothetical protein CM15mP120_00830 [Pseudomonadota bacterium]|nr:MAG: hypothetical protein CM15mP120_00830 [Pseudomonadota bacterium]
MSDRLAGKVALITGAPVVLVRQPHSYSQNKAQKSSSAAAQ